MGLLGFSTSNARDAPRSLRYSELRKRGCRTARSGQGSIRRSARRRAFIRAVRNALSQGGTLRRSAVFNAVENLLNEAPRQAAAGGSTYKRRPREHGSGINERDIHRAVQDDERREDHERRAE